MNGTHGGLTLPTVVATGLMICGWAVAGEVEQPAGKYDAQSLEPTFALIREVLRLSMISGPHAGPPLRRIREGADRYVTGLVKVLKHEDLHWRCKAALALSSLGPAFKAAVPALTDALKDVDPRVRRYAARALGRMGPEADAAVEALTEALADADADVCRAASDALMQIKSAVRFKTDLEKTCGGRWIRLGNIPTGTILQGTYDLTPGPDGARNTMFLIFPWPGDEEGIRRALEYVADWERPMKIIWKREWTVLGDASGDLPPNQVAAFGSAVLSVIKKNLREQFPTLEAAVNYMAERAEKDDIAWFQKHMERATPKHARGMAEQVRRARLSETYQDHLSAPRGKAKVWWLVYHDSKKGLVFSVPLEDTGKGWIIGDFAVLRSAFLLRP